MDFSWFIGLETHPACIVDSKAKALMIAASIGYFWQVEIAANGLCFWWPLSLHSLPPSG
jgi:hypothetical protein